MENMELKLKEIDDVLTLLDILVLSVDNEVGSIYTATKELIEQKLDYIENL